MKQYENVSNLFTAYPYEWEDFESGKEKTKMVVDEETFQPKYETTTEKSLSPQRIFVQVTILIHQISAAKIRRFTNLTRRRLSSFLELVRNVFA